MLGLWASALKQLWGTKPCYSGPPGPGGMEQPLLLTPQHFLQTDPQSGEGKESREEGETAGRMPVMLPLMELFVVVEISRKLLQIFF